MVPNRLHDGPRTPEQRTQVQSEAFQRTYKGYIEAVSSGEVTPEHQLGLETAQASLIRAVNEQLSETTSQYLGRTPSMVKSGEKTLVFSVWNRLMSEHMVKAAGVVLDKLFPGRLATATEPGQAQPSQSLLNKWSVNIDKRAELEQALIDDPDNKTRTYGEIYYFMGQNVGEEFLEECIAKAQLLSSAEALAGTSKPPKRLKQPSFARIFPKLLK